MTEIRSMIAKVHIARKDLALDDTTYRALLMRVTGRESCSKMNMGQISQILDEFKRLGWKPRRPRKSGQRKMADDAQSRMVRGMWITLAQNGIVRDSSEEALAAYVKRMTGMEDLAWLNAAQVNKVINGLRSWLQREGLDEA